MDKFVSVDVVSSRVGYAGDVLSDLVCRLSVGVVNIGNEI
ncbi:MAG: hypothetical protein QG649_456 [Patescibacteria group bacterium]|jgi:hypothetical protein|nr:hypothetical protein [Patescibacteria group bacterium]